MRAIVSLLIAAMAAACASTAPEPVGSSDELLISSYPSTSVTTPTEPGFTGFAAQEPSGAFASSFGLVGGINTRPVSPRGWATYSVFGTTITKAMTCDMEGNGTGCVSVPKGATGVLSYASDSTVVPDGTGNVAFVGLADTNGKSEGSDGDELAVAAVSTNGGGSFDGLTVVNSDGCGTGGYVVDQPDAKFDYTTSPATLWVVYRWRASSGGTYGACIRRGIVDTSVSPATIHWLGAATNIEGIGTGAAFPGVGAVRVVAGDGVVTVAYSSSAFIQGCPSGTAAIDWGSVDSYDNGQTWVDNAKIFDSGDFHWCVASNTVAVGLRSFDITRAPVA